MPQPNTLPTPSKDEINLLPPFEVLGLDRITVVKDVKGVERAAEQLHSQTVWGFDTESKPTFVKDEVSDGPHVLQLATEDHAWVFQLHDLACRQAAAALLTHDKTVKAGFGLGDDKRRIQSKLGVVATQVVELNALFLQRGYRRDMGVKAAVAVMFGQRFSKSKKASTSNWANITLSPAQVIYAANDAWAAARVYHALNASPASTPARQPA